MGVQGLWPLLEPVGRRVNIEAIQNKRLAVDASIWLWQFMRAMRDDHGDMAKNAHLRGFFSRICRLLFHKVRPIFVFDGTAPALKRSTHIARRRRREAQEVQLRKTAEKLLFNQLKKQALEVAKADKAAGRKDASEAAQAEPTDAAPSVSAAAGSGSLSFGIDGNGSPSAADEAGPSGLADSERELGVAWHSNQSPGVIDIEAEGAPERLRAGEGPAARAAGSGKSGQRSQQVEADEELARHLQQQWQQAAHSGAQDRAAGPSSRSALLSADEISHEDAAAIAAALDEDAAANAGAPLGAAGGDTGNDDEVFGGAFSAEELAVMQTRSRGCTVEQEVEARDQARSAGHLVALSLPKAASEASRRPSFSQRPARAAAKPDDGCHGDDDDEEDGEDGDLATAMALPSDLGSLDAEVLSTLPQSLQLEILEKMRDAQATANREKFQEAAASRPESFSSVQLQTYLKASAFRQKIEGFKRKIGGAADGAEEGASRRLASDESREFVFRRDGKPATSGQDKYNQGGFLRSSGRAARTGLSAQNAAALAAPLPVHSPMAPLRTKVALVAFEGTFKKKPPPGDDAPSLAVDQQQRQSLGMPTSEALKASSASAGNASPEDAASPEDTGIVVDVDMAICGSASEGDLLFCSDGGGDDSDDGPSKGSAKPDDGEVEWEDVSVEASAKVAQPAAPADWHERMAVRQRFWSTSHGFRLGRKLGEWESGAGDVGGASADDHEPPLAESPVPLLLPGAPRTDTRAGRGLRRAAAGGPAGSAAAASVTFVGLPALPAIAIGGDEDEEMQEAIRRSLLETGAPSAAACGADDACDDLVWEDADGEAPLAHPVGPSQRPIPKLLSCNGATVSSPAPASAAAHRGADVPAAAASAAPPAAVPSPAAAAARVAPSAAASDSASEAARPRSAALLISSINRRSHALLDEPAKPGPKPSAPPRGGSLNPVPPPPPGGSLASGVELTPPPPPESGQPAREEAAMESPLPDFGFVTSLLPRSSPAVMAARTELATAGAGAARPPPLFSNLLARHKNDHQDQSHIGGPGDAALGAEEQGWQGPIVGLSSGPQRWQAGAGGRHHDDSQLALSRSAAPPLVLAPSPSSAVQQQKGSFNATALSFATASGHLSAVEPRAASTSAAAAAAAAARNVQAVIDLEGGQPSGGPPSSLPADGLFPTDNVEVVHDDRGRNRERLGSADGGGSERAPAGTAERGNALAPQPARNGPLAGSEQGHAADTGEGALEPLMDIEAELRATAEEGASLRLEAARAARSVDVPTAEMYAECQELLQIFGLPFIIAPVEAEAQCAWLDSEGLVDGVVTDDNDAFLFGCSHLYRHIFDDKRYVEEYRMSDVERELGLPRDRLVELAMLLGSDYTEGISGIGIVNAVEVVHAFGQAGAAADGSIGSSLRAFRAWLDAPDVGLLAAAARVEGVQDAPETTLHEEDDVTAEFKRKHRNIRKTWQVPSTFPSEAVMEAYLKPHVDRNKSKFTFGSPDLQLLRKFCFDKFGWTEAKSDSLLVPVLKAYQQRQAQLTMDQFLTFNQRFAKIKSKRLQKAVMKISGNANPEIMLADVSALRDLPSHVDDAGDEAEPAAAATGAAAAAAPPKKRRASGGRGREGAGIGDEGEKKKTVKRRKT